MGPLKELFATGDRETLELFFVQLQDVCGSSVDTQELLCNASVAVNGIARYSLPSSKHESSHDDRRGPSRPANGDRRPCLSCNDMMRFREWYVVTHARVTVTMPAWVCVCGDETFVRPGPFDQRTGRQTPGRPPSRSMDARR